MITFAFVAWCRVATYHLGNAALGHATLIKGHLWEERHELLGPQKVEVTGLASLGGVFSRRLNSTPMRADVILDTRADFFSFFFPEWTKPLCGLGEAPRPERAMWGASDNEIVKYVFPFARSQIPPGTGAGCKEPGSFFCWRVTFLCPDDELWSLGGELPQHP